MKTLLRGARIYDGTGNAAFTGDILLDGDRILSVAPDIDCTDAEITDLTGLSVSPGFFDGHSHNDWFAVKKDPLKYFEPFIRQGITSFVSGNCGISAFGFEKDTDPDLIGAALFGFQNTTGLYPDLDSFFNAVDGHMPCNMAALVGHCTARAAVAGWDNRKLTDTEQARMLSLMEQAFRDGACGASVGLMYVPGEYADVTELREVARLCEKYDLPMTVHPRAESTVSMAYPQLFGRPHILRAMDELYEAAKGTRLKLQYSHMIFVGRSTFKCKKPLLDLIDRMRGDGIDVRFDIYNETLGVSVITVVLPAWYQSMTPEEKRKPWNKLRFTVLAEVTSKLLGFGWNDIQIAYVGEGNEKWEGKTIARCAKEMGVSNADAYLALCEMSDFKGRVNMGPYTTEGIIHELEKHPLCNFMTDAWIEDHGVQNPAVYDNHPKFLRDALLGTGDTMPGTVRKMTGAVVDRFSLPERGYIREGYYADLTVFDEKELSEATPDQQKPFGIKKVFINGHKVLDNGILDEEALLTSGRAVRATRNRV